MEALQMAKFAIKQARSRRKNGVDDPIDFTAGWKTTSRELMERPAVGTVPELGDLLSPEDEHVMDEILRHLALVAGDRPAEAATAAVASA